MAQLDIKTWNKKGTVDKFKNNIGKVTAFIDNDSNYIFVDTKHGSGDNHIEREICEIIICSGNNVLYKGSFHQLADFMKNKLPPEITITQYQIEEATKHYNHDNFLDFINVFFYNIHNTPDGIEFQTWTKRGVNMVHYFHATDDCYFNQLKQLAGDFDIDEEIELHRQDKRYSKLFTITDSVTDFESYQIYLQNIVSILK